MFSKLKEKLKSGEFSKKLTIWFITFYMLAYIVSSGLTVWMGTDLSMYTAQLTAPILTILGFYFTSKTVENVNKYGNKLMNKVESIGEEVADEMNGKNG